MTPEDAYLPYAVRSFSTTEAAYRILLRYPPDGHRYIFSCAVIIFHPQGLCKVFELGIDGAN